MFPLFALFNFYLYSPTKTCRKRLSRSVILSTVSAYSYSISSKRFYIERTHILPGCHVSKQTFKSSPKYEILPICISFYFLFFSFPPVYILRWQRSDQIGMKARRAIWVQRYTSESLSNLPPFHLCQ